MICSDCKYYEQVNGSGYCKIKHPDLSPTLAGNTAVWPVVYGTDSVCGEFKAEGE